jgi:YggT family protein
MAHPYHDPIADQHEHVTVHEHAGRSERRQVVEDWAAVRYEALTKVTQLIWLLTGSLEAMIGLRIALKLIAANPANPFAALVYGLTDLFLWPFYGLTITPAVNGMVLELSSLIAMVVYAVLGWITVRLLWLLFYRVPSRSVSVYEHDHPH